MEVIGFKESTFTAPDGGVYPGYKVYCRYDGTPENKITGDGVDSFFITKKKAGLWSPALGQEIELRYNRYGKIDSVEVVDAA